MHVWQINGASLLAYNNKHWWQEKNEAFDITCHWQQLDLESTNLKAGPPLARSGGGVVSAANCRWAVSPSTWSVSQRKTQSSLIIFKSLKKSTADSASGCRKNGSETYRQLPIAQICRGHCNSIRQLTAQVERPRCKHTENHWQTKIVVAASPPIRNCSGQVEGQLNSGKQNF